MGGDCGDWVWLGTSCSPNICLPTPPLRPIIGETSTDLLFLLYSQKSVSDLPMFVFDLPMFVSDLPKIQR